MVSSGLAGDAGAGQVDDVERYPARVRSRSGTSRDDGEVGDLAIGHGGLGARQAAVGGGELDGLGRHRPDPLGEGEGSDRLARRQLRQPGRFLGLGAGGQQELGGQEHRGAERNRSDGAAQFLGDQAELQV